MMEPRKWCRQPVASHGAYSSIMVEWLYDNQTDWPKGHSLDTLDDVEVVCHIVMQIEQLLIPLSNYDHLKLISAWVLCFIHRCRRQDVDMFYS